jgi:hypothetical protein
MYLEIQVDTDPPMVPRQKFSSVPYSLHAGIADRSETATSADTASFASDIVCAGCVDPIDLAGGAPIVETYIIEAPGEIGTISVFCDAGDPVSGGGVSATPGSVQVSRPVVDTGGSQGWQAGSTSSPYTAYAVCIDNPPLRP